jgi:hypothetical protein
VATLTDHLANQDGDAAVLFSRGAKIGRIRWPSVRQLSLPLASRRRSCVGVHGVTGGGLARGAVQCTVVQRSIMLAGLMRRENESWPDLLVRLNAAVMQSVVDGRVINELHLP